MSIHSYAHEGSLQSVKDAIEAGASANSKDEEQNTPLHFAASNGFLNIISELVHRGADVNSANKFGVVPLMESLRSGKKEASKLLLENGASVNVKDLELWTPLHYASLHDNTSDIIETLLQKHADINALNKDKQTALHVCASAGFVELMVFLIKKGAKVELSDAHGKTAFAYLRMKEKTSQVSQPSVSFKELSANMKHLLNSHQYNDITFQCTDGPVHAHRCVLYARCPSLIQKAENPVKVETSKNGFHTLLEFVYGGNADVLTKPEASQMSLYIELLHLSDVYKVSGLSEACEYAISMCLNSNSKVELSKQDVSRLLESVKRRDSSPFASQCTAYLMKSHGHFAMELSKLSSSDFAKILKQMNVEKLPEAAIKPSSQLHLNEAPRTISGKNLRLCLNIMKLIKKDQHAVWFLQPVDPERDGAPNYFTVIKHPMDLGTIQKNLDENKYFSVVEWIADIRLVFANALEYNLPGSTVYKAAEQLQCTFEMKLSSSNFDKPGKIEKKKSKETPKETPSPINTPSSSSSSSSTPSSNNQSKKRKPESEKPFKENKTPKVETPLSKPKGDTDKHHVDKPDNRKVAQAPVRVAPTPSTPAPKSNGPAHPVKVEPKPASPPGPQQHISNGVPKKPTPPPAPKPMTFEEKKRIGEMMNQLTSTQLMKAIELISETKKIKTENEEEIDIDMNDLDDITLRRVEKFIKHCLEENKRRHDDDEIDVVDDNPSRPVVEMLH